MYNKHNKLINDFALANKENLLEVFTFVQLTIQQSLHTVPHMQENVRVTRDKSRFLWGNKRKAYVDFVKNLDSHYEVFIASNSDKELLTYCIRHMHGLGLVKAGFFIQLVKGTVGCLDMHNLSRLGLKASDYATPKSITDKTLDNKIDIYLAACLTSGGSEVLWNDWCNYVATNQPNIYNSGFEVSKIHVDTFNI